MINLQPFVNPIGLLWILAMINPEAWPTQIGIWTIEGLSVATFQWQLKHNYEALGSKSNCKILIRPNMGSYLELMVTCKTFNPSHDHIFNGVD